MRNSLLHVSIDFFWLPIVAELLTEILERFKSEIFTRTLSRGIYFIEGIDKIDMIKLINLLPDYALYHLVLTVCLHI